MRKRSLTERTMSMSDQVWDRHANPWSGWSRMTVPPLFVLAVCSREWIGWWCLLPILAVMAWTWWNPRAFAPARRIDNWMSKGVLGERLWLDRHSDPIPGHHRRMPQLLAVFSGLGLLPLAWGLWGLEVWPTLTGLILIMGGKLWFLDRMVWLYNDMRG